MSKDNKFIPLYQTIYNEIKHKITNGELRAGAPLPQQSEIARSYGTSEITSRRALAELVKDGFIFRVKGKGTFVAERSDTAAESADDGAPYKIYFVHPRTDMVTFHHRFFIDMLSGIALLCNERDIEFRLWEAGPDYALPDEKGAAFIVMTHMPGAGEITIDVLSRWKAEQRSIVTVHFYYPHLRLPYVISDNLTGGYLVTQHLISLGHRKIAIILTGKSQFEMNQEFSLRFQGYKLALEQHKLALDPQWVIMIDGKQEDEQMGYQGFERLLRLAERPTAVFATSDMKAIGALRAARNNGFHVPGDVSIAGYDNVIVSPFLSPPLTTIDQSAHTLGYRAAEMLASGPNDGQIEPVKDEVVPKLIVRGSTAEPPSAKRSSTLPL